jgi:FkbM family methyltransferase
MDIKSIFRNRFAFWAFFIRGNLTFFQSLELMIFNDFPLIKKERSIKLFGKPFKVLPGNLKEACGLLDQVIIKNQYHIDLIKKDAVVIDAGANMGFFSIFVAVEHPDATVYAFEPTPLTFAALKNNVKYYPNIKVFNYALGESEGNVSIVAMPNCGSNYIGEGGTPIEMKIIDSLNMRMDFLKMDVEGYEGNILKGAKETIKKWKPIIAMSAYHKPEDKTELPKLVNSIIPYDCELYHDYEEDFICQPR